MATHDLKTDLEVFDAVWDSKKNFEIRKNDRDFQVGDKLLLRGTVHTGSEMLNGKPLVYTGSVITAKVRYVLRGPKYGLADGWCVMDITDWVIESKLQTINAQ